MPTTDELEARSALKQVNRLRERIAILERRLAPRPHGSAAEAFQEFWKADGGIADRIQLAQLAFDAGHALRHRKANSVQQDSERDAALDIQRIVDLAHLHGTQDMRVPVGKDDFTFTPVQLVSFARAAMSAPAQSGSAK